MPKVYSDEEKERIVRLLKYHANELMQERGVKKTTVDELVKRAGIPKGTFYLFYPSKEMLLFDVSQDFHEKVDKLISDGMLEVLKEKNIAFGIDADFSECIDGFTDVILGAMEMTFDSCLKVLLKPDAMNLILSKLPEEVFINHRQSDKSIGEGMIEALAEKKGMSVEAVVGSFMMIIFGGMYKKEIGEENWRESTRLLIKGLMLQLLG